MDSSNLGPNINESTQPKFTLREGEELWRAILENGPALTTITNEHGLIEYCSPQCEKVIGWPREEIIGLYMPDFIHPGDKQRIAAEREKATKQMHLQDLE